VFEEVREAEDGAEQTGLDLLLDNECLFMVFEVVSGGGKGKSGGGRKE